MEIEALIMNKSCKHDLVNVAVSEHRAMAVNALSVCHRQIA